MRLMSLSILLISLPTFALADDKGLDCQTVGALIGAPVPDLVAMSGRDFPDTWQTSPDADVLICTWYTEPNARLFAGSALVTEDYLNLGLLMAQVNIYKDPLPREVATTMNMAFEAPPGAGADDWIFGLRGVVPYAPLAVMPLEVRDDGPIGVSVSGGATLGDKVVDFDGLTQEWQIEAALRIRNHLAQ